MTDLNKQNIRRDFQNILGFLKDSKVDGDTYKKIEGIAAHWLDFTEPKKVDPLKKAESQKNDYIVLEVGHGDHPDGFEPGAVDSRTGTKEHDMNMVCAQACKNYLEDTYNYINVHVTDSGDYLGNIGKANRTADIFVSCHHNAFSDERAQGAEALIHKEKWHPNDEKLALLCAKHFAEKLSITNRGIKYMNLSVLSGAMNNDKPAQAVCLVEPYFITGADVDDHTKWSTQSGEALACAIHDYLVQ